jgi:hypothetical protein
LLAAFTRPSHIDSYAPGPDWRSSIIQLPPTHNFYDLGYKYCFIITPDIVSYCASLC